MTITVEEIQTLSILDAIEGNSRATQRELSQKTGLNLAKVNFLLRKMTERGLLKLRNISKNKNKLRYLYILTPGGIAEKSRLTLRFAKRTLMEYSRTMEMVRQNLLRLSAEGGKNVLLLGATDVSDMVIEAAEAIETVRVVGIVAPSYSGKTRRGIPVLHTVDDLLYDFAIPCDDVEIESKESMEKSEIPREKLWLM